MGEKSTLKKLPLGAQQGKTNSSQTKYRTSMRAFMPSASIIFNGKELQSLLK